MRLDRQDTLLTDVHALRIITCLSRGQAVSRSQSAVADIDDFSESVGTPHLVALWIRDRLPSIGKRPAREFDERLSQRTHRWYTGNHDGDVALHSGPHQAEDAREGHVSRRRVYA